METYENTWNLRFKLPNIPQKILSSILWIDTFAIWESGSQSSAFCVLPVADWEHTLGKCCARQFSGVFSLSSYPNPSSWAHITLGRQCNSAWDGRLGLCFQTYHSLVEWSWEYHLIIFMHQFLHICKVDIDRIYHAGFLGEVNEMINANVSPVPSRRMLTIHRNGNWTWERFNTLPGVHSKGQSGALPPYLT